MIRLSDLKAGAARRERSLIVSVRAPLGKMVEVTPTEETHRYRYPGDSPMRLLLVNPGDVTTE